MRTHLLRHTKPNISSSQINNQTSYYPTTNVFTILATKHFQFIFSFKLHKGIICEHYFQFKLR